MTTIRSVAEHPRPHSRFSARAFGAALASALIACNESPPPAPVEAGSPKVQVAPLYIPPPPEGCARTGSIEMLDSDPACVVTKVDDTVMREAMKQLSFELTSDASTVLAGSTVLVRLAITNRSGSEAAVVFEAQPPSALSRPDWTRLAGVPEPKPAPSAIPGLEAVRALEGFRLFLTVRTVDTHDRTVDGLPSTPPTASSVTPKLLRVRLRPGGKLTHVAPWWALRIPTPAPITRDDAGHRYVPKTQPIPLFPGDYTIAMDVPLHGVLPPESTVTTRIRVDKFSADAATSDPPALPPR